MIDLETKSSLRALVHLALDEKYLGFIGPEFEAAFERAWIVGARTLDEGELWELLKPPTAPSIDVQNQLAVALLIERFWRHQQLTRPIGTLHSAVYATGNYQAFRTTKDLEDYDGELPTPPGEVLARLDELERVAEGLVGTMIAADVSRQARFLAFFISAIIRIHPFHDGNGRTARMFAQYALRSWGRPFLPLPKVRNDEAWKSAMSSAVNGQLDELARSLENAMRASF